MKLRLRWGAVTDRSKVKKAREAFKAGEAKQFVDYVGDDGDTLKIVADNSEALRDRGIYEKALVHAYVNCKSDHRKWSMDVVENLFQLGDRERLRSCGSSLPGNGPFVVYRGVGREGRERQVRGMSWTLSLDTACGFAMHFGHDPAVYQAKVTADDVYCYCTERSEEELICRPRCPKRLQIDEKEMKHRQRWYLRKADGSSVKEADNLSRALLEINVAIYKNLRREAIKIGLPGIDKHSVVEIYPSNVYPRFYEAIKGRFTIAKIEPGELWLQPWPFGNETIGPISVPRTVTRYCRQDGDIEGMVLVTPAGYRLFDVYNLSW